MADTEELSQTAAAARLGLTYQQVASARERGELPAIEPQAPWRYHIADVDRFARRLRAGAARIEGIAATIDETLAEHRQTVERIHRLKIQLQVEFNALEADARAESDPGKAEAIRNLAALLRRAEYRWSAALGSWIIAIDGQCATSRPVASATVTA